MFSTKFKNQIMDNIFGGNASAAPFPAAYWVGLSRTAMTASGSGVTEPSGGNYSRVPVSFSSSNNGSVYNPNNVEFPKSTGNWGSIVYCVLFSGSGTTADALWCKSLTEAQTVTANNTLIFPPHELTLSFQEIAEA